MPAVVGKMVDPLVVKAPNFLTKGGIKTPLPRQPSGQKKNRPTQILLSRGSIRGRRGSELKVLSAVAWPVSLLVLFCLFVCFVACLFCVLSVCCVFGGFFFSFLFVIGCCHVFFLFFVVEAFICVSQVTADWWFGLVWSGTVGGKPFFSRQNTNPNHQLAAS